MTATAVRDPLRTKALSALRDGRVMVIHVVSEHGCPAPVRVVAKVRTSRPDSRRVHVVDLSRAGWQCTCDAWKSGNDCAHLRAVQMVTGGAQ